MQNPVKVLNDLLEQADNTLVSDVHCEPRDVHFVVRMRQAGTLSITHSFTLSEGVMLIARLKVMAGLDAAQRLQDGRFSFENNDIRVSLVPVYGGEKAVLRILRPITATLAELGMAVVLQERVMPYLSQPGLLLVGGATGSGKTTTIHALLKMISSESLHVLTLEDPIEYVLPGVAQIAISPTVPFAAALRSALRQDPDIIFLGEIRDSETAQVAIQAALTGHTVLATIHARDTAEIALRMLDLGVSEKLFTAVSRLRLSQSLYVVPDGSRKAQYEVWEAEKN